MSELLPALMQVRSRLLDPDHLLRAVGSGRRRGEPPRWRRVELRYVDLKAGRRLQVTAYDDTQAHTSNHELGPSGQPSPARDAVDDLLDEPFGNWHVDALTDDGAVEQTQLRVTRKGDALVHTGRSDRAAVPDGAQHGHRHGHQHDRAKDRLLPEDDPVFRVLGLTDVEGRLKPSRQGKYRQVEEFLRLLDSGITDALAKGHLRAPTPEDPLRVVDLGCGNSYLTFAAERFLASVRELPVRFTGVDVREQARDHHQEVAGRLGVESEFVVGTILGAEVARPPDVVLALHACDTATDEALARAVGWGAALVLAAPCCHHDIAAQLRTTPTPSPYAMLTRHGILRERFADTLTDALRSTLMRLQGYRVEVVQFVESQHTPRNTLLRATLTGRPVTGGSLRREYDELVATWGVRPRLSELLDA